MFSRTNSSKRSKARSACGPFFEPLESRQLMASVGVAADVLRIDGTESDDRITVQSTVQTTQLTKNGLSYTVSIPMLRVKVMDSAGTLRLDNAGNPLDRSFSSLAINKIYIHAKGGADNVNTTGTSKKCIVYLGAGNDVATTGAGADSVYGESGNDHATLGAGDDYFNGGSGHDTGYGGLGADTLAGGSDRDQLFGDAGNDQLDGGGHDDKLRGGDGNDVLYGGWGNDFLLGGAGSADQIFGDAGNDWMDTGSSGETAIGGAGDADWNARVWAIDGIWTTDINQAGSGTCVFLSALASAARNYNLADRITYLGDFVYKVKLYDFWKNPVYTEVSFNGTLKRHDGNLVDPAPATKGEFWTILYQRAYLKLFFNITTAEGMADFDGEHNGEQAIRSLTGRNTWTNSKGLFGFNVGTMMDEISRGEVLNAGGSGHRYSVIDIWESDRSGGYTVKLYNPWGVDDVHDNDIDFTTGDDDDGYIYLSWNEFNDEFTNYSTSW